MNPEENTPSVSNHSAEKPPQAIVAIGGGAGSAEALTELLSHLSPDTGAVYVYIQHPEPTASAITAQQFSGFTPLNVQEATEGQAIAPDHLYILSAEKALALSDGHFEAADEQSPFYTHLPVNRFFMTLAENYKEQAVGVLLSGTSIDGGLGLKNIKLAGGFTLAQDETARNHTMPKSAVSEGAVDLVLPPQRLAEEIVKLSRQVPIFKSALTQQSENALLDIDVNLHSILQLLHRSTGVDFEQYKMNTVKRRLLRRIMLYKMESAGDYLSYLRQNVNEVNFLYQDLLINVTSFFRDRETTEYLVKHILPKIIQSKSASNPIRVWVPACSTGQEAYSLAMLILEALGENTSNISVQLFATDLSESAVIKARNGLYTKDEVAGVSPKRLQRFFSKPDGHFRINKAVRDVCVFANHNIAKDPPFTKLDLISCCNLLIYLDTPLQKKVISTFHYALNNNGYLVLGKSETVGTLGNLFTPVDKKVKVYNRKTDATSRAMFDMAYRTTDARRHPAAGTSAAGGKRSSEPDLEEAVDNLLLKKFTPASVLVNADLDILQFRGSTGLYLEPVPGKASLNLMKMAKPGLSFELRNIVHKARKTGQAVKKTGLEITVGEKRQQVSIEATPLKTDMEEAYFLVVFEETPQPAEDVRLGVAKDRQVKQLEAELTALREDMHSILEEQEAANEELQSANEEIVSSNEELQSINEELETSKEEIESSNEELITINQELQLRNEQLAEAQEYSNAIFHTISEAVVVLDRNLMVRSANRSFYKTFAVREEDTEGRMIYDLGNKQWDIPRLRVLLDRIIPQNTELSGYEVSHTFNDIGEKTMRLNACRVIHMMNRQEMILLTIQDITEYKRALKANAEREAWFRNMADNAPVMIWVTGDDGLCTFLNKLFLQFRGITPNEAVGKSWTLGAHPEDLERITNTYEAAFAAKQAFELTYRLHHLDGSYRNVHTRAHPNYSAEGAFTGFIGTCVELDEMVKVAVNA